MASEHLSSAHGNWILPLDGSSLPDRALIGGKAWSIAHMRGLGMNVPPAFVVTTEACRAYLREGRFPDGLAEELKRGMTWLEHRTRRAFGRPPRKGSTWLFGRRSGEAGPLLVSVRSGAAVSMPGMMDTVLNLGITDAAEAALAEESRKPAFARDTRRRFYELYISIVLKRIAPHFDPQADAATWQRAMAAEDIVVPEAASDQLTAAVGAVFESWNSRRAKRYRAHHGIPDEAGTAVTIQAMVFGNLDERSGTGVLFTRNPLTGENKPYGEYLACAQGEDVVSGKFTPEPLDSLARKLPEAHRALLAAGAALERADKDVQDVEFTVQKGELFLLQARAAKRAPKAAVRIAVDMVQAGTIDEATALDRVSAEQARILLRPHLADGAAGNAVVLAQGDRACEGVGTGVVVADTDSAVARHEKGEDVVLARATTSPEDVHGMIVAKAILTEVGGSTSHAAVVSRALGVPCIVGCGPGALSGLGDRLVTVDATTGHVYDGALPVAHPDERADPDLVKLAEWAAARVPLRVVRPSDPVPENALDLDETPGGEDPARLPELLKGHASARGGAIASDAGVRAALGAGLNLIVAEPILPPLLAAWHAMRGHGDDDATDTPTE